MKIFKQEPYKNQIIHPSQTIPYNQPMIYQLLQSSPYNSKPFNFTAKLKNKRIYSRKYIISNFNDILPTRFISRKFTKKLVIQSDHNFPNPDRVFSQLIKVIKSMVGLESLSLQLRNSTNNTDLCIEVSHLLRNLISTLKRVNQLKLKLWNWNWYPELAIRNLRSILNNKLKHIQFSTFLGPSLEIKPTKDSIKLDKNYTKWRIDLSDVDNKLVNVNLTKILRAVSCLGELYIDSHERRLTYSMMKSLERNWKPLVNCENLLLSNVIDDFSEEAIASLTRLLPKLENLKTLRLRFNKLRDVDQNFIIDLTKEIASLKKVDTLAMEFDKDLNFPTVLSNWKLLLISPERYSNLLLIVRDEYTFEIASKTNYSFNYGEKLRISVDNALTISDVQIITEMMYKLPQTENFELCIADCQKITEISFISLLSSISNYKGLKKFRLDFSNFDHLDKRTLEELGSLCKLPNLEFVYIEFRTVIKSEANPLEYLKDPMMSNHSIKRMNLKFRSWFELKFKRKLQNTPSSPVKYLYSLNIIFQNRSVLPIAREIICDLKNFKTLRIHSSVGYKYREFVKGEMYQILTDIFDRAGKCWPETLSCLSSSKNIYIGLDFDENNYCYSCHSQLSTEIKVYRRNIFQGNRRNTISTSSIGLDFKVECEIPDKVWHIFEKTVSSISNIKHLYCLIQNCKQSQHFELPSISPLIIKNLSSLDLSFDYGGVTGQSLELARTILNENKTLRKFSILIPECYEIKAERWNSISNEVSEVDPLRIEFKNERWFSKKDFESLKNLLLRIDQIDWLVLNFQDSFEFTKEIEAIKDGIMKLNSLMYFDMNFS